jgi:hypothetical protein
MKKLKNTNEYTRSENTLTTVVLIMLIFGGVLIASPWL